MRVTASYKAEILKLHTPLKKTMEVCRSAVSWLIPVIDGEWEELAKIPGEHRRFNAAEKLIHSTKRNTAKYAFDTAFPKMPSYLRRAVLRQAAGMVSSYRSGPSEGQAAENHCMPVFYKDNMYRKEEDRTYLKLYNGKDWVWQEVRLKKTDVDYLRKNWSDAEAKSPVLVKRHRKYYLQFAFEQEVMLTEKPAVEQVICAVDLGINTDAVCSIMTGDGTVAARKFIKNAAEKDRLEHVLNRVRKKQREQGGKCVRGFCAYAKRLNEEIARKTAGAIVAFAAENHADVIVFEHLDTKGKVRGKKRQKLHMWKKQAVQGIAEQKAHRAGMRISRVSARNTSALAYDGSGEVKRDRRNHSLATFGNGRRYNSDLSASYNIGARYYIRELLKPVPETERSALTAKVPAVQRRTTCVYADLLKLKEAMGGEEEAQAVLLGDTRGVAEPCVRKGELSRRADRKGTRSGCLKQPAAERRIRKHATSVV